MGNDSGILGFILIMAGIILVFIGIGIGISTGYLFGPIGGQLPALQAQQFAQFEVFGFVAAGVVCALAGVIILLS